MNARPDPAALGQPLTPTLRIAPAIPAHDARDLTGPGGLAQIRLDGQVYALRITRAGKLILTK